MKPKHLFKPAAVTFGCLLAMTSFAGGPDQMHVHHHDPFSGFFIGPHFGVAMAQLSTHHTTISPTIAIPAPDFDDLEAFSTYGFDVGYGRQWDWLYAGAGFSYSSLLGEYTMTDNASSPAATVTYKQRKSLKYHYNFNVQLGYVFNHNMMAYIAPGFSAIDMRDQLTGTVRVSEPTVLLKKMAYAPSIGAGMKFLLTPHFSMGFHTMYEIYQSKKTSVSPNTVIMKVKHYSQVNVNLNYLVDF